MVAGREIYFVFQRSIGRVQAGDRGAGWNYAAARDRAAASDTLLYSVVVAGFEKDCLYRHESQGLGARRGERANQDRGGRSVHGSTADGESGVESGFEVGGVCQPFEVAVSRNFYFECGNGGNQADHRWAGGRGLAGLG